jgi:hypothetical protein
MSRTKIPIIKAIRANETIFMALAPVCDLAEELIGHPIFFF